MDLIVQHFPKFGAVFSRPPSKDYLWIQSRHWSQLFKVKRLAMVQHLKRGRLRQNSDSKCVTLDLYECNWKQKEVHSLLCQRHKIFQIMDYRYQTKCIHMFCMLSIEILCLENFIILNAILTYCEGSLKYLKKNLWKRFISIFTQKKSVQRLR